MTARLSQKNYSSKFELKFRHEYALGSFHSFHTVFPECDKYAIFFNNKKTQLTHLILALYTLIWLTLQLVSDNNIDAKVWWVYRVEQADLESLKNFKNDVLEVSFLRTWISEKCPYFAVLLLGT